MDKANSGSVRFSFGNMKSQGGKAFLHHFKTLTLNISTFTVQINS